jgi:hypothetical protein
VAGTVKCGRFEMRLLALVRATANWQSQSATNYKEWIGFRLIKNRSVFYPLSLDGLKDKTFGF